ncbi:MAG TPA: lytic murein transglycosylase [Solirubrobacteraceae bacterium]
MTRRRKLSIAAVTIACMVAVFGLGALPNASADGCTFTITVAGGQQFTFQNVPPGTDPTSLPLPVSLPITNVAQSCPPVTATTPAATVTTTTPAPTTSTSTSTSTSTTPKPKPSKGASSTPTTTVQASTPTTKGSGKGKSQSSGLLNIGAGEAGSNLKQPGAPKTKSKSKKAKTTPAPPPAVTKSGVPTPSNPTYSYALPGPAPIGVPNFFISSFQIPPFLLPIYQAAGIQYDVPWQILAAINEIETDYGRNLSVSSAGAVGWMQFLPSTWKRYAVDANGDGVADPYNPADAIFTAARYLHAAGASKSVQNAIFAYNHAGWYVQSVMLRAQLIGGMPKQFINSLTDLVQGHFPVAAPAKYADDAVLKLAKSRVKGSNAAVTVQSDPNSKGTAIYANQGSPVIAVNDGKVVKIGQSQQLGHYVVLQDATGNTYTYANLGSVPKLYPVPRPVRASATSIAKALLAPSTPSTPAPSGPATAGSQQASTVPSVSKASKIAKKSSGSSLPVTPATTTQPSTAPTTTQPSAAGDGSAPSSTPTISAPMVKERLFANPSRPASYAAGGKLQVAPSGPGGIPISNFQEYFSDVLHLAKNQYTLRPLKAGSQVVAGTILGRLGAGTPTDASHLEFMIQPAGKNSPYIDPKPILDGWKLLEATAVYRAAGVNPFYGPRAKNPTIGQILLMSKEQLQLRALEDPNVTIYPCGRRDIQDGAIDRRVLAVIEFLSASGLKPTVSGLKCGATPNGSNGIDAAGASGASVDFSAINGIPIAGHTGAGSITDVTVRRLLTLQGAMQPNQIVSTMSYKNQPIAVKLASHANRIQVSYTPFYGENQKLSAEVSNMLQPNQWTQLINHLSQISEPLVPIAPSKYAIKTGS